VDVPLHLQVSSVSPAAQKLVEAAGGSVTRVYYTRLGLRALLKVGRRHRHHCRKPPKHAWCFMRVSTGSSAVVCISFLLLVVQLHALL
jgi:hypothetical protein